MRKYFDTRHPKKLMQLGGILFFISIIVNFFLVLHVYSYVGQCLDTSQNCGSISNAPLLARLFAAIGYIGIVIFIFGLLLAINKVKISKRK